MRNTFNPDTPIMQWATKISLLLWMNCLWFVCCLPIVTIGASSAALYRMSFNLREDRECSAKAFFIAFKENFKQATLIWLILLLGAAVIAGIFYGALVVASEIVGMGLTLIVFGLVILWGFVFLYSFPLASYFVNSLRNTMVNALAMSIKHLKYTIFCFALAMIPVIALMVSGYWFLRILYIWILIYPSLVSYWITGILSNVFEGYSK